MPYFFLRRKECPRDIPGGIASSGDVERIQYLREQLFRIKEKLRRLAKINGARHRAMVAFITTGDLEKVLVLFRIGESSRVK